MVENALVGVGARQVRLSTTAKGAAIPRGRHTSAVFIGQETERECMRANRKDDTKRILQRGCIGQWVG